MAFNKLIKYYDIFNGITRNKNKLIISNFKKY